MIEMPQRSLIQILVELHTPRIAIPGMTGGNLAHRARDAGPLQQGVRLVAVSVHNVDLFSSNVVLQITQGAPKWSLGGVQFVRLQPCFTGKSQQRIGSRTID